MPLTIHHLQTSQSSRILWLAEELQIPYTLVLHHRDPIFSPPSIKALHPLGQAPIIQDTSTHNPTAEPLTLAESAACAEYMVAKYGNGRLVLPASHQDYASYLYWFHFANGGLQATSLRLMAVRSAVASATGSADGKGTIEENVVVRRTAESMDKMLRFMDERLGKTGAWLAGEEFTLADIMSVFTLTTMRVFSPLDLSGYGNLLKYLKRVGEREGFRRAVEKGDPGMDVEEMIGGKAPEGFVERLKREGRI